MAALLKEQFLGSNDSLGYGYNTDIDTIRKEQYPQLKGSVNRLSLGSSNPNQSFDLLANPLHCMSPIVSYWLHKMPSTWTMPVQHFLRKPFSKSSLPTLPPTCMPTPTLNPPLRKQHPPESTLLGKRSLNTSRLLFVASGM